MFRRVAALAAGLLFLTSASVSASTTVVTINGGNPPPQVYAFGGPVTVAQGDTVQWNNNTGHGHTATGNSPLSLWSKSIGSANGSTASEVFTAAGVFPYHCAIHTYMKSTVSVPMKSIPTSGTTATTFDIRWATTKAVSPFKYYVQQKQPGGSFTKWKHNLKAHASFTTAVTGTWRFRARVERVNSSGTVTGFSDWSPVLAVNVS